jgi:hypothetical protein
MSDGLHQVFISYASSDKARVRPVYDWLKGQGVNVWIDFDRLMPGQNWDFEIKRAIEKSCIVIFFISKNSVEHRGYVQREIHIALDRLPEKLVDDVYIIPVMLDDGLEIPDKVRHIQCINAYDVDFKEKILKAIEYQLGRLGIESELAQREQDVYWSFSHYSEKWEGLPGYAFEMQLLSFRSEKYKSISDIEDVIKGVLLDILLDHRLCKLSQSPETYNYGQSEYARTDTFDAHCREPVIVGRIIGIQYSMHWYNAGAAHPNMGFQTFSFFLDPLVRIKRLESVFLDSERDRTLSIIQTICRDKLRAKFLAEQNGEPLGEFESDWINEGTKDWDCFNSFLFRENGVELLFAPYTVACYAAGPQSIDISYKLIFEAMKREYACALGIEYLAYRMSHSEAHP